MNEDFGRELLHIDTLLRRAAGSMSYPATPDLVSSVRVAINEKLAKGTRPIDRLRDRWPAFALSGAFVAIVIAFSALLAVPTSRTAVANFFGLDNISFFEDNGSSPTPPVLSPESFARPSSAEEVQTLVDFPVVLPDAREPNQTFVQGEEFDMPIAILVYDRYDIYETRQAYLQKGISGDAPVTELEFDGHRAYWVEAGGHIVQSLDAEGRVLIETRRTVERGTLLWEADGITYRIESDLSQEETVAVAQSFE